MQVNTNSWHYRLVRNWSPIRPIPYNLCPYTRAVIYSVFFVVFFLGTLALIGVAMTLAIPISVFVRGNHIVTAFSVCGAIGWTLVLSYTLSHLVTERRRREVVELKLRIIRGEIPEPRNYLVAKPPGLLRLWLRAAHDRVCPQLEFKE